MIYYVLYLIWDVIPLTVIMRFHSKKIKRPSAERQSQSFNESISEINLMSNDTNEFAFMGNPEYAGLLQ